MQDRTFVQSDFLEGSDTFEIVLLPVGLLFQQFLPGKMFFGIQ